MATYIYCARPSQGALELVKAMGAQRLRRFDGMNFWARKRKFIPKPEDILIVWGGIVPDLDGMRVLNGLGKPMDKYKEWTTLMKGNVPTIQIYDNVSKATVPGLLPRIVNHVGGMDLLQTPDLPDYYVVKENFVKEYRIHSFGGRSIRAGVKVPREGFTTVTEDKWRSDSNMVHPWVRSFEGGWRVNYDGFKSNSMMRNIAHKAVKALGLTFGAVDIAELPNKSLKVLEVNRAPGIEGGTIAAYVRAIERWRTEPTEAALPPDDNGDEDQ